MISLIVLAVVCSIIVESLVIASIIISLASSAFLVEPHFFLRVYFRFLIYFLLTFIDIIVEIRKFEFDLTFHFRDLLLRITLFQKIHKFRVEKHFLIGDRHMVEFTQFFAGAVGIVDADGACMQKGTGFLFFAFWEEYTMRVVGM